MTTEPIPTAEMQRVSAVGRLAVRRSAGRSRLARLYQEGAAKIRMPAVDADPFEAVLINTAGGLTGGDRLSWQVEVDDGAAASVTTQACEKVYRSAGGRAEVSCSLGVGRDACLAWLPQETIVYREAALARRFEVDLAPGARLLMAEATVFGRLAMGETVDRGMFRDRWRVRRDGRLVHAEEFAVGPDIAATLARSAATGGATAMATVLLVDDDPARHLDAVRAIVGERGGASVWSVGGSGKLLARLVEEDGYCLRRRLVPLLDLLNGKAGLPKTWSL
jgi:urease accessory protein